MNRVLLNFKYELPFNKLGILVAGVDEAGRGPLAGPVVAAAVILRPDFINKVGINDSKQLSAKKREELFDIILNNLISIGVGIVDNDTIDKINILQATQKAMYIAIGKLNPQPGHLLIDGNYFLGNKIPFDTIIKGDSKCLSIAAASIIAKVTRDRWMIENAHTNYPEYGFDSNKGYGTKAHIKAIVKNSITPLHRKTFLNKILNKQKRLLQ